MISVYSHTYTSLLWLRKYIPVGIIPADLPDLLIRTSLENRSYDIK